METKFGFTKMTIAEFENFIANIRVARTILNVQQHHTFSPNYALFNGKNHFELQRSMRNTHMNVNGWSDIGQHFTVFPDGTILTGRSLENSPACIYGQNSHAICFEHLGNFDKGKDIMTNNQKNAIIRATAAVCLKFNIAINTAKIVYHHWFKLDNGIRNDGAGGNKSCPGTNFFGGNKVADCEANFLPLVRRQLAGELNENTNTILKYVAVTAPTLNIRKQPSASSDRATDREAAVVGAVLRVYKIQNGWYKISGSKQHWVNGQYTVDVTRTTVNTTTLNVRNQPQANALKIGAVSTGEEVFVYEEKNGWCKISIENKWVKKEFLKF